MVSIWQISTNERRCHSINAMEDIDFITITTKVFNLKNSNPHEMFKVAMTVLDKRFRDPH
jgi:hypothetical protein